MPADSAAEAAPTGRNEQPNATTARADPPPSSGAASAILAHCARELQKLARYDVAAKVARILVAENDTSADAHSVLASALDELARWPEALDHWQRAAELAPNSPLARFNLGLALLRLGDCGRGFPLHEGRVARPDWTCRGAGLSGRELYEARIDKPDWTGFSALPSRAAARHRLLQPGAPVGGRTILVLTEQGLGDCIMFARYVPMLAERGARVLLACSPPLHRVFARIAGVAELLSPPPEQPMAKLNLSALEFDAWVPLLSLPLHLGDSALEPVANVPYLHPDPARRSYWRGRYEAAGHTGAPKVGLVFQANPASPNAEIRSFAANHVAQLMTMPGIDWIVLQQGPIARDLASTHSAAIDPDLRETSLDDFAAAVAATDLLLTVDTMAAHCAGAIGHPAWVAVPYNPNWFWGISGTTTPWYPTLHLFRQEAPRDWPGVIRRVGQALGELFRPGGSRARPAAAKRRAKPPGVSPRSA